jgi:hypothetical protein
MFADSRTAMLFDAETDSVVGLLSITDFIHVLLRLRREREALAAMKEGDEPLDQEELDQTDLSQLSIADWRGTNYPRYTVIASFRYRNAALGGSTQGVGQHHRL